MRILDRYIVRQFLLNTFIVSFVLLGLFVLVDFIIDVDEFLKAGRSWAEARHSEPTGLQVTGMTLYAIVDHYTPTAILLYVYFCGLFVVAGMAFTLANLIRTRELVAMVTGGISMYRIALPILLAGFVVIAVSLPVQEYIVPHLAPKLARSKSQIKYGTLRTFPVHLVPDGQGNLLSAATFDINQKEPTLEGINIIERDADTGAAVRRIQAESGWWDASRHGWEFTQGYALPVPPSGEGLGIAGAISAGLPLGGEIEDVPFYPTSISPDVLLAKREAIYVRLMSMTDLLRLRANPAADQAQISQVLWSRFSMLVVNVLILVMALPLFLLREPGNMLIQAAKAAALTMGAWGAALVILQVGGIGAATTINPVTAAWLPVVLYLPLSAGMLMIVKT